MRRHRHLPNKSAENRYPLSQFSTWLVVGYFHDAPVVSSDFHKNSTCSRDSLRLPVELLVLLRHSTQICIGSDFLYVHSTVCTAGRSSQVRHAMSPFQSRTHRDERFGFVVISGVQYSGDMILSFLIGFKFHHQRGCPFIQGQERTHFITRRPSMAMILYYAPAAYRSKTIEALHARSTDKSGHLITIDYRTKESINLQMHPSP
jgi:hypothetical protein